MEVGVENERLRWRFWRFVAHECDEMRAAFERARREAWEVLDHPTARVVREVQAACNLPARSLPGLEALTVTPENGAAIEAARALVGDFQRNQTSRGLYLHGPLGTGKTSILAALAFDLRHRTGDREYDGGTIELGWKADAQFWPVPDLFAALNRSFDGEPFDVRRVERCSCLLLDDIGKQYDTAWKTAELFRIVNARYNALRSTCYTSNHAPADLARRMVALLGPAHASDVAAMVDRIQETCDVVALEGGSWRRKAR